VRTGGCPPPFVGTALAQSDAPVPVSAVLDGNISVLTVTFDRPLTANPALDISNWYCYSGGWLMVATSAAASGNTVQCAMNASDPAVHDDTCTYDPPPFDVLSSLGVPAAGFADFPLS
jgi:hypothetical protein